MTPPIMQQADVQAFISKLPQTQSAVTQFVDNNQLTPFLTEMLKVFQLSIDNQADHLPYRTITDLRELHATFTSFNKESNLLNKFESLLELMNNKLIYSPHNETLFQMMTTLIGPSLKVVPGLTIKILPRLLRGDSAIKLGLSQSRDIRECGKEIEKKIETLADIFDPLIAYYQPGGVFEKMFQISQRLTHCEQQSKEYQSEAGNINKEASEQNKDNLIEMRALLKRMQQLKMKYQNSIQLGRKPEDNTFHLSQRIPVRFMQVEVLREVAPNKENPSSLQPQYDTLTTVKKMYLTAVDLLIQDQIELIAGKVQANHEARAQQRASGVIPPSFAKEPRFPPFRKGFFSNYKSPAERERIKALAEEAPDAEARSSNPASPSPS